MRFLQKIKEGTLLTRWASHEIWKSLEPLLLQIERSQRRWFGHVSRMPQIKLPNKLYWPKQMGKKTVRRPRTIVDESILRWGSWVEFLGTSPKQNDGNNDVKTVKYGSLILSCCPRNLQGKEGKEERESFFIEVFNGFVCFSTVCFVICLFVTFLLFVCFYSYICSNFSFHLPASLLPQLFLIDELLEFQLHGGKTYAFDSIVIRPRNSSWQPIVRIYKSSNSILLVDLLMFIFIELVLSRLHQTPYLTPQNITNMTLVSCCCNYS